GALCGLLSSRAEQIPGPEHAYRARHAADPEVGGIPAVPAQELRERLEPVVQRPLRRQVREYARSTNRRSMVEDFAPSEQEQSLYDDVSEYPRRSEAAAIEPRSRTLLRLR